MTKDVPVFISFLFSLSPFSLVSLFFLFLEARLDSLTIKLGMTLAFQCSCLQLPSAKIIAVCHYAQLKTLGLIKLSTSESYFQLL